MCDDKLLYEAYEMQPRHNNCWPADTCAYHECEDETGPRIVGHWTFTVNSDNTSLTKEFVLYSPWEYPIGA